ncbi:MAG TPA: capsule biosynthesis protein [Clostridiales bacterium]|nr:MAG: hypothetical protein A2Y40_06260 [Candidatus Margulisbacteria bacterium GWF2_35_9]HAN20720.1 capsule biosynthesis protein [Clostridiales bacterium]
MNSNKTTRLILILTIISILFCACKKPESSIAININLNQHTEISEPTIDEKPDNHEFIRQMLAKDLIKNPEITEIFGEKELVDFIDWLADKYDIEVLYTLAGEASDGKLINNAFHSLTGFGLHTLYDSYSGHLDPKSENYMSNIYNLGKTDDGEAEFGFVGDVMFADNSSMMRKYNNLNKGILSILDDRIIDIMKSVDIMTANNEFALSLRGSPINGKTYTFRASPSKADIWHEMGVDVVSLANNHVFDYGEDAFLDTLDTLDAAGIKRMGAGRNIDEAGKPVYYIINGYKIALLAATRAEKNIFTPEATETSGGVMYTYDSTKFCKEIKEAKAQSDFVIINVHWGYELTTQLETAQLTMGKEYIDSGADLIIGHHAHTLQGIDSYKGKVICYNLGNFLFNKKSVETGILIAKITSDGKLVSSFIPCYQQDIYTRLSMGEEFNNTINRLRSISTNVDLSNTGIITPLTNEN